MRYEITIDHAGLGKIRRISGPDKWLVEEKARLQTAAWDNEWKKRTEKESRAFLKDQKIAIAIERTTDAQKELSAFKAILSGRKIKSNLWRSLRSDGPFPEKEPHEPASPELPDPPNPSDTRYRASLGIFDRIFVSIGRRKETEAATRLKLDQQEWTQEVIKIKEEFQREAWVKYSTRLDEWKRRRADFLERQRTDNERLDNLRIRYEGREPDAIEKYCGLALSRSDYPAAFPDETLFKFLPESGLLVVDHRLPAIADLPSLKQVKFVVGQGKFEEIHLKENEINALYDAAVYQICLRTIFELFGYDKIKVISAIVYNGWVDYIDPANGKAARSCIVSVHADKMTFENFNLDQVDPRACFKALKGVGSSKLHNMAAVPPLVRLNKDDPRFIANVEVEEGINESTNLAAIGWEDFEQLIREIFEQEFSRNGGEVKVTRASRDGGVDAVAFDPDPIRGGKIVIQAKRYTNTVDVSAVRDLYGTVMNEGATKGILVTTSSYGPDAYAFAKDKPITLLDGGNLIYLLQQHGQKAYINLKEAKQLNMQPLMRRVKA